MPKYMYKMRSKRIMIVLQFVAVCCSFLTNCNNTNVLIHCIIQSLLLQFAHFPGITHTFSHKNTPASAPSESNQSPTRVQPESNQSPTMTRCCASHLYTKSVDSI